MRYFAKIENDKVVQVIVADPEFINNLDGEWVETWKVKDDMSKRKRYAGIGMVYDRVNDVFINEKPYPSWIYDNGSWIPPIEKNPNNLPNISFEWNEEKQKWDKIDIPNNGIV